MQILPLKERSGAGRFAIVDDADFQWVTRQPWPYRIEMWGLRASKRAIGYAGNHGDLLHRAVAERSAPLAPRTVVVHHNGWGLDNRRLNLLRTQRGRNKSQPNIHRDKRGWRVLIVRKVIGRFETQEEADVAHEKAAREAGCLTPMLQAELLAPVIAQLEAWVMEGRLIRHNVIAPLIEDRYRLNSENRSAV